MGMFVMKDNWGEEMREDGTYPQVECGMKRKFHFETTLISCKGVHKIKQDRYLDIADMVVIGGEMYRIQEDPKDGIIFVVHNDYTKGYEVLQKHEDDVESVVWCDYEEY